MSYSVAFVGDSFGKTLRTVLWIAPGPHGVSFASRIMRAERAPTSQKCHCYQATGALSPQT